MREERKKKDDDKKKKKKLSKTIDIEAEVERPNASLQFKLMFRGSLSTPKIFLCN